MINNGQLQSFKDIKIYNYSESSNIKLSMGKENTRIIYFKKPSIIQLKSKNNTNNIQRVRKIEIGDKYIKFKNSSGYEICNIDYEDYIYIKIYTYISDDQYFINIGTKDINELNSCVNILNELYPKFRYELYSFIYSNDTIKYKYDIYVKPSILDEEIKIISTFYISRDRCTIDIIKMIEMMSSSRSLKSLLYTINKKNGTFIIYDNKLYEIDYIGCNYLITSNNESIFIEDFLQDKKVVVYDNDTILYINNRLYNKDVDITNLIPIEILSDLEDWDNSIIYSTFINYSYILSEYTNPIIMQVMDIIKITLNKINTILEYGFFDDGEILHNKIIAAHGIQFSKDTFIGMKEEIIKIYDIINTPMELVGIESDEEFEYYQEEGNTGEFCTE